MTKPPAVFWSGETLGERLKTLVDPFLSERVDCVCPSTSSRGQAIFLIWYASPDCETAFKKDGTVHKGIDPELVTAVAGELQSFASLSKEIKDVDKALGDRVHRIVVMKRRGLPH